MNGIYFVLILLSFSTSICGQESSYEHGRRDGAREERREERIDRIVRNEGRYQRRGSSIYERGRIYNQRGIRREEERILWNAGFRGREIVRSYNDW